MEEEIEKAEYWERNYDEVLEYMEKNNMPLRGDKNV